MKSCSCEEIKDCEEVGSCEETKNCKEFKDWKDVKMQKVLFPPRDEELQIKDCEEVKIYCSSAKARRNSGKEALAKRSMIAKKIKDGDGKMNCCTCEEIMDGKEIEYSEVVEIG